MELTGIITNILPVQSGIGRSGSEWKKQEIIIQPEAAFSKVICITLWGETIDENIKRGDKISAVVDIVSREYQGKWYTTVKAWKINLLSAPNENEAESSSVKESNDNEDKEVEDLFRNDDDEDSGLPF